MNIAIIGKFYTEGFGLHIEETLSDMGHTIVRIDPEMEFLQYNFLGKRIKNINKTMWIKFWISKQLFVDNYLSTANSHSYPHSYPQNTYFPIKLFNLISKLLISLSKSESSKRKDSTLLIALITVV